MCTASDRPCHTSWASLQFQLWRSWCTLGCGNSAGAEGMPRLSLSLGDSSSEQGFGQRLSSGRDGMGVVKSLSGRFCWKGPWLCGAVGFGSVLPLFPNNLLVCSLLLLHPQRGSHSGSNPLSQKRRFSCRFSMFSLFGPRRPQGNMSWLSTG